MKVEVLVASMTEDPKKLFFKMNIQTNAIISNQTYKYSYEEFVFEGNKVRIYNSAERGVGKNRNLALDCAKGDICILADDDEIFISGYEKKIISAYKDIPHADVIIFNLIESNSTSLRKKIKKTIRVRFWNYMRYGAARISFRRTSVTKYGTHFNVHFGGGTEHSAGEDVLFLNSCLKNKLKIYAVNIDIAKLDNSRESTWFNGYTKKYFIDKGILFASISRNFSFFLCLQFILRKSKVFNNEVSKWQAFKWMLKGIKLFDNGNGYK